MMEKTIFVTNFASGKSMFKGKYSLLHPFWYRGILTVRLTQEKIIITCLGMTVWESLFSQISSVQIRPEFLGGRIDISLNNGDGFQLLVSDWSGFIEKLKELNWPLKYDADSLKKSLHRFNIASNPVLLAIGVAIGIVFLIFIIFNITKLSYGS